MIKLQTGAKKEGLINSAKTQAQMQWLHQRIRNLAPEQIENIEECFDRGSSTKILRAIEAKVEELCLKKRKERERLKNLIAHREIQNIKNEEALELQRKADAEEAKLERTLQELMRRWETVREQNLKLLSHLRKNQELANSAFEMKSTKMRQLKSKSADVSTADAKLGGICSLYEELINPDPQVSAPAHGAGKLVFEETVEEEAPRIVRPIRISDGYPSKTMELDVMRRTRSYLMGSVETVAVRNIATRPARALKAYISRNKSAKDLARVVDSYSLGDTISQEIFTFNHQLSVLRASNYLLQQGLFQDGELEAAQDMLRKLNRRIQYRIERCSATQHKKALFQSVN